MWGHNTRIYNFPSVTKKVKHRPKLLPALTTPPMTGERVRNAVILAFSLTFPEIVYFHIQLVIGIQNEAIAQEV